MKKIKIKDLEPSLKTAALVYWSSLWRSLLVFLLLISFIASVLAAVIGNGTAAAAQSIAPLMSVLYVVIQIWALQKALAKHNKRIVADLIKAAD